MTQFKMFKLFMLAGFSSCCLFIESGGAAVKKYVAITQIISHPALDAVRVGIKEKVVAYAEQNDIELLWVYENAQGNIGVAAQIANKFAGSNPDVIVAISTPSAQTVINATRGTKVPVVFTAVTDPVIAKLVTNMEKPGDRITGTYDFPPIEKQLDLMLVLQPQVKTVGFLYSPGEVNSIRQLDEFKKIAAKKGLVVVEGAAGKSTDVLPVTHKLLSKVDAIYVPQDNVIMSALAGVTALSVRNNIAVYVPDPEGVKSGGLATIGFSHLAEGHACGDIVVRILSGEDPGKIAIKQPKEEKIFVNLRMAAALGIKIPKAVLDKSFIWR